MSDVVGYEVRSRKAYLTLNRPDRNSGRPIPDGGGQVPTAAELDEE